MRRNNGCMLWIVLMVGMLIAAPLAGGIPPSERAALIALYKATNGDLWENNSGWKTPPLEADGFSGRGTEGSWAGIGSSDHVFSIEIRGAGGYLPPELENLPFLSILNVEFSGLTGRIPPEIGNLSQLTLLDLRGNHLTGTIPPEIGKLKRLIALVLCRNRLSGGLPPELGQLTELEVLRIRGSLLQGRIPAELGNLTKLSELVIWGNVSGAIPATLTNLKSLWRLSLHGDGLYTEDPKLQAFLRDFYDVDWTPEKRCPGHWPSLLAKNSIIIASGAVVHGGDVCVTDVGTSLDHTMHYEVIIAEGARLGNGVSIYANNVKVKSGATVYDIYANEVVNRGMVTGYITQPLELPLKRSFPEIPLSAPAGSDIILEAEAYHVLPPGSYGAVVLGKKAILCLTGGDYQIENISMGDYAQIRAWAPVCIVVQKRLESGLNPVIAPAKGYSLLAAHVIIHVKGVNGMSGGVSELPKAVTLGARHKVAAAINAPNGTIWFKPRGDAEGSFFARDIIVDLCSRIIFDSAF